MPRILEKLRVREISAVDRGAGEGVKVMLMKRDDPKSTENRTMTKSFTEVVKTMLGFGKASVADEIANANDALAKSIDSILGDSALDATAKSTAIAKSFDQHAGHLNGTIPAAIEKALSDAGLSASDFTKGTPDMTIDYKKALGLPADATDDQVTKALETQAADAKALIVAKRELAIAKMSDKHTGFMNNAKAKLPSGGKESFADMSAKERDDHMSKNPIDPEDADEDTQKRDADFAKRMAADPVVIDLRKRVDDMTKREQITEVRKAWGTAGLTEPQMDVVQKAWEASTDKAPIEAMVKQLAAANAQAREAGIFKEFGGSGGNVGATPHDEIMAKAHELRKAKPELTIEQAYAKAYEDPANREIAKRDVRDRRQAMGAA
jgi:hypothetical protein